LDAAVVSRAYEFAAFVENCRTDRNAALSQTFAGFGDCHVEHRSVIGSSHGLRLYGRAKTVG
jgi:hypothetical protein